MANPLDIVYSRKTTDNQGFDEKTLIPVPGVKDFSSTSNHGAQSNASVAPTLQVGTNGRLVLRFTSDSAHYMSFATTLSGLRTAYWVVNEDGSYGGGYNFLLGHPVDYTWHSGNGHVIFGASGTVTSFRIDKAAGTIDVTSRPTTLKVVSAVNSNGSAASFAYDRGFGRCWCGDLALLLLYSALHDAATISATEDAIKSYLAI